MSPISLNHAGVADTVTSATVSNDFFRVFGVEPLVGRSFTDDEVDAAVYSGSHTHIGSNPVVILSHHLWRQCV